MNQEKIGKFLKELRKQKDLPKNKFRKYFMYQTEQYSVGKTATI